MTFVLWLMAMFGPASAQPSALPDAQQPSPSASPASPQAGTPTASSAPSAQSAPRVTGRPTQHAAQLAAALFTEGTALFKQWRFDEAAQKFREALTHWEHPLIHLYLSRSLEKQGQLVEAYQALQQALRPGVEPLPPEDVLVAEDLQQSLQSRLAQIEVSCDVSGTEVSLDGQPWFTAPGRQRRMIGAGQHVLVARKPGYFPVAEPVSLIPGKQTRVVLRMTADVVRIERRWRPWQLWAVAGTGIAMSLTGGWLRYRAARDYAFFKEALDSCSPTISCQMVSTRLLDSGERKERVGIGMLIVGGTALAAGLGGVLLNQPRTWRSEPADGIEDLDLAPMVSSDAVGISAWSRF
jgi:tetratricopeptide (TPR) repeat protein